MGISGLLPLLKSIHKATHLRNFSDQTLGVDAYGWLHRGTVACAIDLAQGKPTRKHIEFALHRVRMLIHFGVKPYFVFDGDYLPSKAHTEKERAARRKESKRVGLDLLRMGRTSQAQQELQKAIDVTPTMARELIDELKRLDVPYVVAPYEADSQLAYLEKQGIISGVISEDSDLLVFGVKCLLIKLDQYGECVMINRADFTSCREISLVGWTDSEFRMMAMLSGCDYLPGIEKLGLKTAYRLIRKHKNVERIIRHIQFDGKMKVPAGYLDAFTRAERTFLHQWVYCPQACRVLNLTPLPAGLEAHSLPYLGSPVNDGIAIRVAKGELDPNTKQPLAVPSRFQNRATEHRSISTPLEKQGKPITEFFRRRTPLAELDPNSFTPSPSQQRLLQLQANPSWSASQVRASEDPDSMPATHGFRLSSEPQPSRRIATFPGAFARRESPKRQRLCSDSATSMSAELSLESATSRFFAKPHAQDSPSLRGRLQRNENDQEFELWSDDSLVDALAEAATSGMAPSQSSSALSAPRKRKKLDIFKDTPEPQSFAVGNRESQSTETSTASLESQLVVSQVDTPATSIGSSPARAGATRPAPSTKVLSKKFGLPTVRDSAKSQEIKPPISLPRSRTSPDVLSSVTTGLPAQRTRRNELVQVSASPEDQRTSEPTAAHDLTTRRENAVDDDDGSDQEWLGHEREHLRTSELAVHGSEDCLVPDSPEQASAAHDARSSLRTRMDFGQFLFAE